MRRVRVVARGNRGDSAFVDSVVKCLREHDDLFVDVRPTWEAGDALGIATEAAVLGVDVLVAAGGDGTLHEVVNGIARQEHRPVLGLIPLGTANDFARSAGLERATPTKLAQIIARADPVDCDVIRAGDRFFINVAAGGFPADAAGSAPDGLKRTFGGLAYLLSGIAHLGSAADSQFLEVEGPDFEWSGSYIGFAVANARCAGGGHRVAPTAVIDDGELDLVVLPGNRGMLEATRLGADLKIEAVEEHVLRWRVPWVKISGDSKLRLNMDGEPYQTDSVRFDCLPRHQPMLLPEDAPILSSAQSALSS